MGTPYKVLSDGVLDKLESSGYPQIAEHVLDNMIFAHIRTACVKFRACRQDLNDRDDILERFNIELDNEEVDILVGFLLVEYIAANYINTPLLLRSLLSSKDFSVFSPANHLNTLRELRTSYEKETRQKVSMYSSWNSGLFDILKRKQGGDLIPPEPEPYA